MSKFDIIVRFIRQNLTVHDMVLKFGLEDNKSNIVLIFSLIHRIFKNEIENNRNLSAIKDYLKENN